MMILGAVRTGVYLIKPFDSQVAHRWILLKYVSSESSTKNFKTKGVKKVMKAPIFQFVIKKIYKIKF